MGVGATVFMEILMRVGGISNALGLPAVRAIPGTGAADNSPRSQCRCGRVSSRDAV